MRLLAVSDIHGRTGQLDRILAAEVATADAVVVAGDMVRFLNPEDLSPITQRLAATRLPVLAVAGNCDGAQVDALLTKSGYNVRATGRIVGDRVGFCGVAGAPPWVVSSWFVEEDVMAAWIEMGYAAIADAQVKVLVTHAPPVDAIVETASGASVRLPGSTAVREAVERLPFDAVICGHIHEGQGIGRIGNCLVVCCAAVRDGRYARLQVSLDDAAAGDGGKAQVEASLHRLPLA